MLDTRGAHGILGCDVLLLTVVVNLLKGVKRVY
jgi:hypothetical protein